MNAVEQWETLATLFGAIEDARQHLADGAIGRGCAAYVSVEDALNALRAAGWTSPPSALAALAELGSLWDDEYLDQLGTVTP